MLEEKKKEIDYMIKNLKDGDHINKSTAQLANNVGCALHHLGVSMGKFHWHQGYQKEIDVYSEALRLKHASKCSETLLAETLLAMSVCY